MNSPIDDTDLSVHDDYIPNDSISSEVKINEIPHELTDGVFQAQIQIEAFVTELLSSDDPAFVMMERLIKRNDLRFVRNNLDRLPLARYFTTVINLLMHHSPAEEYSPHIELFFQCGIRLELWKEWFCNPRAYTSRPNKPAYELFNDFIDLIRQVSRESEFRRNISDCEYNASRNYKSAVKFVIKLLARRQLVLRVDFSYRSQYANTVTPLQAKADLADFLKHFRNDKKLTENLEGYLWKWEFSAKKKMHCHLLFFYDSSKVQNDAYWASRIVALWEDLGGLGQRKSYNGNTKENKKKFEDRGEIGIGVVARIGDDSENDLGKPKRDILLNIILKYIMKPEQYLLAIPRGHEKYRLFGKGYGPNWRRK